MSLGWYFSFPMMSLECYEWCSMLFYVFQGEAALYVLILPRPDCQPADHQQHLQRLRLCQRHHSAGGL